MKPLSWDLLSKKLKHSIWNIVGRPCVVDCMNLWWIYEWRAVPCALLHSWGCFNPNWGKVLKLYKFEKGLGISGKSLYVNTWHSPPVSAMITNCPSHRTRVCGEGSHTALEVHQTTSLLAFPSHRVTSRNSLFPQSDRKKYNPLRLNHFLSPK